MPHPSARLPAPSRSPWDCCVLKGGGGWESERYRQFPNLPAAHKRVLPLPCAVRLGGELGTSGVRERNQPLPLGRRCFLRLATTAQLANVS